MQYYQSQGFVPEEFVVDRSQIIHNVINTTNLYGGTGKTDTEVHVSILADETVVFAFRGTEPTEWHTGFADALTCVDRSGVRARDCACEALRWEHAAGAYVAVIYQGTPGLRAGTQGCDRHPHSETQYADGVARVGGGRRGRRECGVWGSQLGRSPGDALCKMVQRGCLSGRQDLVRHHWVAARWKYCIRLGFQQPSYRWSELPSCEQARCGSWRPQPLELPQLWLRLQA